MAQNNRNFTMEEAKHLVQTEAGQKLLSLLQSQNPSQLQAAMQQASSGNYNQLKKTLDSFMTLPETQALLKQLESRRNE